MALNPAATVFVLPSNLDPQASLFVPVSALNAPQLPKFERAYIEFEAGVETMEELVLQIKAYLHGESTSFTGKTRFKQLSVRLLALSTRHITPRIITAFTTGTLRDVTWTYNAIADTIKLYHRYSWANLQMIDLLQGKI